MKITIVYDNSTEIPDLITDWGFSAVVELANREIIFDTGGNGRILVENLCKLDIDPTSFDDIFISHSDFDHIGGLSHLLNINEKADIHVPDSLRGIKYSNKVHYYPKPSKIYDNIYTTGELAEREQSLIIKTEKGLVVIMGCGHPGLDLITRVAKEFGDIYALMGGFHDFKDYELLQDIPKICPTHCTKNLKKINQLYPEKIISGGVGKIITI